MPCSSRYHSGAAARPGLVVGRYDLIGSTRGALDVGYLVLVGVANTRDALFSFKKEALVAEAKVGKLRSWVGDAVGLAGETAGVAYIRLPPEVHLSIDSIPKTKSQVKDSGGLHSIQSIINQINKDVQHSTSAKRQRLSKGLLARHDED